MYFISVLQHKCLSGVSNGPRQRNSQVQSSSNASEIDGAESANSEAVSHTNSLNMNGHEAHHNGDGGPAGGRYTAFLEPLSRTSSTAESLPTPTSPTGKDVYIHLTSWLNLHSINDTLMYIYTK
jgi:hypothetical protein